jgi:Tfp pilus assembly protein PilF
MVFRHSRGFLVFLQCVVILASGCATSEKSKALSPRDRAALLAQVAAGTINEGDPTGGLATLMEAEQYDPENAYIQYLKALAYFYKNDRETALTLARKAVKMDPNYSEANTTLGKLLLDEGKYSEAEPYLRKAAKDPLYRDTFKPETNLGIIHYKRGEFAQAEIHLNRAIQESPAMACLAYYYRGQIQLERSNFADALNDFDNASKRLCGSFEDAHLAVGVAYLRSKQFDKARKKFLDVQKTFPDTAAAKKAVEQLRYLP